MYRAKHSGKNKVIYEEQTALDNSVDNQTHIS
jgi:hypothetical protein